MLRFLQVVARGSQASQLTGVRLMVTTWAAACAAAFLLPWLLLEALTGITPATSRDPGKLWDAAWPLLIAAVAAAAGLPLSRRLPTLPQGDLVVGLEHLLRALANRIALLSARAPAVLTELRRLGETDIPLHVMERLEDVTRRWPVAGLLIAGLTLAIAASLLLAVD